VHFKDFLFREISSEKDVKLLILANQVLAVTGQYLPSSCARVSAT